MGFCQREEREAGRSYPRTCPTCKLGPCQKTAVGPRQSSAQADTAAALPEVQALIAAAYEAAAQTVATQGDSSATEALGQRICCSGHMCGCQGATVEDWLLHLIRALTPADATAALAARDAAMIARGMREAAEMIERMGFTARFLRARAAEIEGEGRITCAGQQSPIE